MSRLLLSLALLVSGEAASEDQDLRLALSFLKEAGELWEAVEGSVLEITGKYETTEPDDGKRRMTQKADFLTAREIAGDRILVHYRPRISLWISGARDYYLEHESIGFDGIRGYTIVEKGGGFPDAKIRMNREITLLKKPREFTTIQYDNGLGAFLAFHNFPVVSGVFDPERFAEMVRRDDCHLAATEEENRVRLELVFGDREGRHDRYFLELERTSGFALVKLTQVLGASPANKSPFTNTIECADFQPLEGSNDLHFPKTCRFQIQGAGSDYDTRLAIESARIRPAEPQEFEAPHPAGWTVYDAATERRWTIGESR